MSEAHTPARPALPSEAKDHVTMRELEQRLEAMGRLMDERTRYEREILSTRENSIKEALAIAAIETRRRLDELNHSHELALENWARSLPRDMFEDFKKENDRWRETVGTFITKTEPLQGQMAAVVSRVGTIETLGNKLSGAFILLGIMGLSGVLALILGIARLSGALE